MCFAVILVNFYTVSSRHFGRHQFGFLAISHDCLRNEPFTGLKVPHKTNFCVIRLPRTHLGNHLPQRHAI